MNTTLDQVVEELGKVAFGPADDSGGSAMKYASKLKALEMLGKHLGLYEKPPEGDLPVRIVDDIGPETPPDRAENP